MNRIRWVAFVVLLLSPALPAESLVAGAAPAQIRFTYENPKLQPAEYVIVVREDGSGHYRSETGDAAPTEKGELPALPQDRKIQVSKPTLKAMFSAARQSRFFGVPCDGGGHNMAFQGKKTLEYRGPDGQGSCIYNWASRKDIEALTNMFEGISLTLEEGSKLQVEYAHSRLELDPELEFLDQMARQGRALELYNISPILHAIAADDANLKRVQRRARELLVLANAH